MGAVLRLPIYAAVPGDKNAGLVAALETKIRQTKKYAKVMESYESCIMSHEH